MLKQSATYLIFGKDDNGKYKDFVGYFTLAIKIVSINSSSFSSSENKKLKRFAKIATNTNSYEIPAILLAQFSKDFNKDSKSINGSELMEIALKEISNIQSHLGGSLIFLECEQNEKIINFYKKEGFKRLNSVRLSDNEKELLQMYMLN